MRQRLVVRSAFASQELLAHVGSLFNDVTGLLDGGIYSE